MRLVIHHPDAINDPYPIDCDQDLEDAVSQEADVVAGDAGSELLADGTEEERDQLRTRIRDEAMAALAAPGDSYTDPAGIRWSLAP